jgi:hypothetical protein
VNLQHAARRRGRAVPMLVLVAALLCACLVPASPARAGETGRAQAVAAGVNTAKYGAGLTSLTGSLTGVLTSPLSVSGALALASSGYGFLSNTGTVAIDGHYTLRLTMVLGGLLSVFPSVSYCSSGYGSTPSSCTGGWVTLSVGTDGSVLLDTTKPPFHLAVGATGVPIRVTIALGLLGSVSVSATVTHAATGITSSG